MSLNVNIPALYLTFTHDKFKIISPKFSQPLYPIFYGIVNLYYTLLLHAILSFQLEQK